MQHDRLHLVGKRLGRYKILEPIGGGGQGGVYRAKDIHSLIEGFLIEREVAVKVISVPPTLDTVDATTQILRFSREVISISHLNHPHILPIFDYDIAKLDDGVSYAYIVMPLCNQGSLADWQKTHSFSPQDVAYLLQQAADALQLAHDNNIFHKDVKPHNFLLQKNIVHPDLPNLLLADFGIVKLNTASFSLGNIGKGTPPYIAPEQWNYKPVAASDQYSLAIMAFQLLTGQLPFQGKSVEVLAEQHLNVQPPSPSKISPKLTKEIDAVILKALSKKQEDRYASINAFAQAFQQAVLHTEKDENIYATLVISESEAMSGGKYPLYLEKKGQVVIDVPRGSPAGLLPPIAGIGASSEGRQPGDLIVTLQIKPDIAQNQLLANVVKSVTYLETGLKATYTSVSETQKKVDVVADSISSGVDSIRSDVEKNQAHTVKIRKGLFSLTLMISILLILVLFAGAGGAGLFLLHPLSRASANPPAKRTPIVTAYPPPNSQLKFTDPLNDNSEGNGWETGRDGGGGNCEFSNGGYLVREPQTPGFKVCYASSASYSNFTFQVTMIIASGDCGGVLFLANASDSYTFSVCTYGSYLLQRDQQILAGRTSTAIHQGADQSNIIAVVANGENIDLYVNHVKVYTITDNTYSQGEIAVIAASNTAQTNVLYSNATLWTM